MRLMFFSGARRHSSTRSRCSAHPDASKTTMVERRMTNIFESFSTLSNPELLAAVERAASCERISTAELVALLVHVDRRRLYLSQGCSSLFTYCTQVLHLSEHAAYGRIEAARAARRLPAVLNLLADGSVNMTTITLLAPHLTPENHELVLGEARYRSKRDVEHIVARLRPQADTPNAVRKLPAAYAGPPAEPQRANDQNVRLDSVATVTTPLPQRATSVVTPTAPERYKVQLTVSRETYDKLRRLQDLLRHSIPTGDLTAIVDRALTLLLADVEKARHSKTERPRTTRPLPSGSRHLPAAVRREVWKRDGGQCAFVGANGRCSERGFLEFHHVEPYAVGGPPSADNIQLRCRVTTCTRRRCISGSDYPCWFEKSGSPMNSLTSRVPSVAARVAECV